MEVVAPGCRGASPPYVGQHAEPFSIPLRMRTEAIQHGGIVRQQRIDRCDVVETGMKLAKKLADLAANFIIW